MPWRVLACSATKQEPGIDLLQTTTPILNTTGGGFTITLHNAGKTPALDVRIRDVIRIEDVDAQFQCPPLDEARSVAAGTLMPGADFGANAGFRTSRARVTALLEG